MGLKRQLQKGDRILVGDDIVMVIDDCYSRVRVDITAPRDVLISVENDKGQQMSPEEQREKALNKVKGNRK